MMVPRQRVRSRTTKNTQGTKVRQRSARCETALIRETESQGARSQGVSPSVHESKAPSSPEGASIFTDQVCELVALGAAVAANCEMCFKHHYNEARKLGVLRADMRKAVEIAIRVKETPIMEMTELIERYLREEQPDPCCGAGSDLH